MVGDYFFSRMSVLLASIQHQPLVYIASKSLNSKMKSYFLDVRRDPASLAQLLKQRQHLDSEKVGKGIDEGIDQNKKFELDNLVDDTFE